MRILVTGHLGYIGTVMVPMLQGAGHEVIGLDSDIFGRCAFIGPIPTIPNIRKDVRDVDASDLEGFDAVVHLAALSNDPLGNLKPEITHSINCEASVKLATLANKAGVQRFLFSSSCSVYGASDVDMLTEEAEPKPITPYAMSKLLAEKGISRLADSNFSPTFLRSATAYGASPKLRIDLVLNNLVAWAYTTGVVLLKSDGMAWRPIVHIDDISRAFLAVLTAPIYSVHNQIFNVGSTEENYQIRELAGIVKKAVPGSRIEIAKDAGADKRTYRVDFSKLAKILPEFKPLWNARDGAKQLFDAFKKVKSFSEDFNSPKYRRLAHLKKLLDANSLDENLRWQTSG